MLPQAISEMVRNAVILMNAVTAMNASFCVIISWEVTIARALMVTILPVT